LVSDALGNLYIADSDNDLVRKVDGSGTITTVAGNGSDGFCGDVGPATAACLSGPADLAFDAVGNLYIADAGNNRTRRVDSSGTITTVAGNGRAEFCGDGGPAADACLSRPSGLTFDSLTGLYIADTYNHRIRRVDPAGNIVTAAGNGAQGECGDGGPATSACLPYPSRIVLDPSGALYIVGAGGVRRIDPSGIIAPAIDASAICDEVFRASAAECSIGGQGLARDSSGNFYVSDSNGMVLMFDKANAVALVAGNCEWSYCGDGGPTHEGCTYWCVTLAVGCSRILSTWPDGTDPRTVVSVADPAEAVQAI